ncbi:paralemmin-2 isoform X1 [Hippoglossus stenolepis]|uniref:paralemmin-2 isoform X1 n=2 Tax=Hippoglossus stenolepis TaxID=195615 RepID=UPI001FAFEF89|nr:paralemmin-2 isoform X1 [Hippoglossus stenolepis]XP_035036893.2 paralemmin-2 isoform X1 [Hippoglossus stenolepis]XP_035036894.2 paralemmin-2 isoform X1 [Hippoglossus stenolepis]
MANRMFHESGDDGRSVMGMLTVQVERDPKTGATVVRSVAPTSAGAGRVHTVFDDGRKSIHTVGGSGGQPSTEELGQILSVIDGVGMEALLDEVTVVPIMTEVKTGNVEASGIPKEKLPSLSTHHAASKDNNVQLDGSYDFEDAPSVEDSGKGDDILAVGDVGIEDVDDQRLKDGPVTLLFLGYTDATSGQGDDQEGEEGMLTAERVIITEDGEEYVLEPETAASTPSESNEAEEPEAEKEFLDVHLEGAGAKVQREDGDKGLREPSSPSKAEIGDTSKPKTCKCCSVM